MQPPAPASAAAWGSTAPLPAAVGDAYREMAPEPAEPDTGEVIGQLALAIGVTFSIIAAGYACRRTGFMSKDVESGLGQYVAKVALPSTLFLAIAQLDLNSINLVVIAVMSVAKVMVFLVGAFVAAVFGSGTSANKMRITGMWGIFSTQSNDLAIGLPIVKLLQNSYEKYLYIIAAVQMCVINPAGYLLMEFGKARALAEQKAEADKRAIETAKVVQSEGNDRLGRSGQGEDKVNPAAAEHYQNYLKSFYAAEAPSNSASNSSSAIDIPKAMQQSTEQQELQQPEYHVRFQLGSVEKQQNTGTMPILAEADGNTITPYTHPDSGTGRDFPPIAGSQASSASTAYDTAASEAIAGDDNTEATTMGLNSGNKNDTKGESGGRPKKPASNSSSSHDSGRESIRKYMPSRDEIYSSLRSLGFFVKTFLRTLLNPVVPFSLGGLLYNQIFGDHLPEFFETFFSMLGNSFPPTSLFLLGASMYAKGGGRGYSRGGSIVSRLAIPLFLTTLKIVASPVLARLVGLIQPFNRSLGPQGMDFVFFYGTIPTAPSVYVFACQYGVQPDVIATSVVFCLLCAAPLMFVTNVLIEQDLLSMMEQHSSDIPQAIRTAKFWCHGMSLGGVLFLVVSLSLFPRHRRRCFNSLVYVVALAQLMFNISWLFCTSDPQWLSDIVVYCFENISRVLVRTSVILLAFGLKTKPHNRALSFPKWIYLLLLAFPLALTLPFALFETPKRKSVYEECLYRFGLPQVIATSCFDVCAAIALFFCLLYSRRKYFPDDGADRQPRLAGREQLTAPLLGTYSPEDQTSHSSSDNDQEEGNAGIIVVADAQSEDEITEQDLYGGGLIEDLEHKQRQRRLFSQRRTGAEDALCPTQQLPAGVVQEGQFPARSGNSSCESLPRCDGSDGAPILGETRVQRSNTGINGRVMRNAMLQRHTGRSRGRLPSANSCGNMSVISSNNESELGFDESSEEHDHYIEGFDDEAIGGKYAWENRHVNGQLTLEQWTDRRFVAQIFVVMEIVNLILELTISLQYNREGNSSLNANSLCVLVLAILLNDGRGVTLFFLFGLQKEVFAYYRRLFRVWRERLARQLGLKDKGYYRRQI